MEKINKVFLSFSEISLDYFNIPEKEKEALLEGYSNANCTETEEGLASDSTVSKNVGESGSGFVKEIPLHRKYKLQDVISVNQKCWFSSLKKSETIKELHLHHT